MLTRRSFLVNGLRISAAVPVFSHLAWAKDPRGSERVLVVLQLSGGNDGLNTVVPHRNDAYFRRRPTISLARGSLHALNDDFGLHPEMKGLQELFTEGRVAIVQGVGYPVPNRSHFRSMEIWHTADPEGPPGDVGWMGRLADQIARERPGALPALHIGGGDLPLALYGRDSFAPTVRDERGFQVRGPERYTSLRDELLAAGGDDAELAFLREAAATTYRAAERMEAASDAAGKVDYPGFELAQRLQLIAQLVAGGFDTRVFHVELGGFDTHARQAPTHAALMSELSQSLTAFQRDLAERGVADRVLTFVFSEFGRRVAENGSKGTDHGAAAPAFLVGSPVQGGLHGMPPDLGHLEDGDVTFTTDFRSLYTSLERDWMGLAPSTNHAPIDLLGA